MLATRLKEFLDLHDIPYDLMPHTRTSTSMQTAAAAHVPGDRLAKTVVLEDQDGFVMAVVPSTHRVELGILHRRFNRPFGLATEPEIADLFSDCDLGAIPPVGSAWGMETIIDPALLDEPEVWFEAGDHRSLVHVSRDVFRNLMTGAERCRMSYHV